MIPKLEPIVPTLGPQPLSNRLYKPVQCTLVLTQNVCSLSDGDFIVQTTEKHHVCKVKGKVLSMHAKKIFTDMEENEIFTLSNQLLSWPQSFRGKAPTSRGNFKVKGHFKMIGSRSTVHFMNAADSAEVTLDVKGRWLDRSAVITWGDRPVARVLRDFVNVRQVFGDQTYFAAVAPNVDLSLIAAICVSLDKKQNNKK